MSAASVPSGRALTGNVNHRSGARRGTARIDYGTLPQPYAAVRVWSGPHLHVVAVKVRDRAMRAIRGGDPVARYDIVHDTGRCANDRLCRGVAGRQSRKRTIGVGTGSGVA